MNVQNQLDQIIDSKQNYNLGNFKKLSDSFKKLN